MKKFLLGVLILITIIVVVVFLMGPMNVFSKVAGPNHTFLSEQKTAVPDYTDKSNWIALPELEDESDYLPQGVTPDASVKDINVFFIHPTGYLKGDRWNSDMNPETATEENTKWMMANQASAFSDCKVYAPRYRQATIFSFFNLEGEDEQAALDLAYEDVARAFEHFIVKINGDAPFIIASHSQGSYHAMKLLTEVIDRSDLSNQLIAAYTIGMAGIISDQAVSKWNKLTICDGPDQTNCVIHWAAYSEEAAADDQVNKDRSVCVNPLTWKRDGERAEKELHAGFVPTSGVYDLSFVGDDAPKNTGRPPLKAPIANYTCATCVDGILRVEKQDEGASIAIRGGNYHGLDFQLFHMDIRKNIGERVKAFRAKAEPAAATVAGME